MKRYTLAYGLWLTGVALMALAALAWYRYVEQIGTRELLDRMNSGD